MAAPSSTIRSDEGLSRETMKRRMEKANKNIDRDVFIAAMLKKIKGLYRAAMMPDRSPAHRPPSAFAIMPIRMQVATPNTMFRIRMWWISIEKIL